MHLGLATIAGAGSNIVASRALYGGSHNLLSYTLKRFRIEITFVYPSDLDAWHAVIRPNTKVLFGETLRTRHKRSAACLWTVVLSTGHRL